MALDQAWRGRNSRRHILSSEIGCFRSRSNAGAVAVASQGPVCRDERPYCRSDPRAELCHVQTSSHSELGRVTSEYQSRAPADSEPESGAAQ